MLPDLHLLGRLNEFFSLVSYFICETYCDLYPLISYIWKERLNLEIFRFFFFWWWELIDIWILCHKNTFSNFHMKEGSGRAWLTGAVFIKDESGALFGCCESSAGGSKNSVVCSFSAHLQDPKADHFTSKQWFPWHFCVCQEHVLKIQTFKSREMSLAQDIIKQLTWISEKLGEILTKCLLVSVLAQNCDCKSCQM